MTGIKDYLTSLPQTVTIYPFTGKDKYGSPTFGAGVAYRARVVKKPHAVLLGDGVNVLAAGAVWVGPPVLDLSDNTPPTVSNKDKIALPDSSTPNIIMVSQYPTTSSGYHHVKVTYG